MPRKKAAAPETSLDQAVLVECTLRRPGGTTVSFGTRHETKYHFKPNEKGHHVCEIPDEGHLRTLLAIEGYQLYSPDQPPADERVEGGRYGGLTRAEVTSMLRRRTREEPDAQAPLSELVKLLNLTDTVYER